MKESPDLGPAPVVPRSESLRQLGQAGFIAQERGPGSATRSLAVIPFHLEQ